MSVRVVMGLGNFGVEYDGTRHNVGASLVRRLAAGCGAEFSRNKYYTVGVICDEKKPKYICYGVPAESRGEPPDALKGYCSFLPLSVFDLSGKGYWMMFQDAETGECVKISQK